MLYLPNNTLLQGGKYKIVRFISAGGFGCTYEGVHTMLDSRVAIKEFFVKDFCNRDEGTSRVSLGTQSKAELYDKLRSKFIDEAKAMFKMHHPNIVRVTDVFEENGTAYFVMDYLEGLSLHEILKLRGRLPEHEAVKYTVQIAEALKYVHSKNRLHLDVKPGNIIVNNEGKAILIDFGASKHYDEATGENTTTLMGINTKGYAPVEQCTQGFTKFSPAADIYALGATLYKMLTGITPPDSVSLVSDEERLEPLPTYVSRRVRLAITHSMKLRRADRLQDMDELLRMLRQPASETSEETAAEVKVRRKSVADYRVKADTTPRKSIGLGILIGAALAIIVGAVIVLTVFRKGQSSNDGYIAQDTVEVAAEVTEEPQPATTVSTPYDYLAERLLSSDELEGKGKSELRILRNAIFARHGFNFKSGELDNFFRQFDWYNPTTTDYQVVNNRLNGTEKDNALLIRKHELGKTIETPYDYLSYHKLEYSEISEFDGYELRILRNGIYARHGYAFSANDLKEYFSQFDWYVGLFLNVDNQLNSTEKWNAAFIKQYE